MKLSKNFFLKQPKTAPIYRPKKYSRWSQLSKKSYCRSTGWLTGQRSNFLPLHPASRLPGRPCTGLDLPVNRPVDWGQIQRAKLSRRSTGSVDRSSSQMACACLCTSVDHPVDRLLSRSTGRSNGRRPGLTFWGLKLGFINSYKIP